MTGRGLRDFKVQQGWTVQQALEVGQLEERMTAEEEEKRRRNRRKIAVRYVCPIADRGCRE